MKLFNKKMANKSFAMSGKRIITADSQGFMDVDDKEVEFFLSQGWSKIDKSQKNEKSVPEKTPEKPEVVKEVKSEEEDKSEKRRVFQRSK